MLLEADEIYQGTSQINQGTGPGRPWCRYATAAKPTYFGYKFTKFFYCQIFYNTVATYTHTHTHTHTHTKQYGSIPYSFECT